MSLPNCVVAVAKATTHCSRSVLQVSSRTGRCSSLRIQTHPFKLAQKRLQSGYAGSYGTAEPPPRSFPVRFLLSTTKLAVGGFVFASLGVAIGIYTLRSTDGGESIASAILKRNAPTDAESLTLYEPPADNAELQRINTHIITHPLAQSLRAHPDFVESRPHMKLPEILRQVNLTGGTLAGPGKIAVPPLTFLERDGRSMVAIFYLGGNLCGHPGIIHGGLLATLLDEGLARCCFPALPNKVAVTASLKIDYRKPVKADAYYVLRARTERVEGRKAWVRGWIEPLEEEGQGQGPPVGASAPEADAAAEESSKPAAPAPQGQPKLVEGEALFIEPRNAKVMKSILDPN